MKTKYTTYRFSLIILLTVGSLFSFGCDDEKPPFIAPPTLRVEVKVMPPYQAQAKINENIPLGAWIYNSAGDSIPGYHYRIFAEYDSIGVVSPIDTWMESDLTKTNGIKSYNPTFVGKNYGVTKIRIQARDANAIVAENFLEFAVRKEEE